MDKNSIVVEEMQANTNGAYRQESYCD